MELFNILDETGKVIGRASREECHNGSFLLHSVVHVLVFNSSGELVLQKRSMDKDIQPGKWDTSVGGHVSFDETLEEALHREAKEELGISDAVFEKLYSYIMESNVEREFVTTFRCIWDSSITLQKSEIEEVRFFTPDEIESHPGKDYFTPNFEEEWEYYKRWLIKTKKLP
ncbi:MAG TPA: NUDIX domain-containing protein [bacterium]|nr:NUDIX domain-containing protein [bacterium]